MNQLIIKSDKIDFQALVKKDTKLSINFQSKIITKLQETFTKEEEQWYVANLFMYLNYHPTNEFPINLENVFKMIGFAHKKNAKRTLENNFTEDEDYKINVLPRETIRTGPDSEKIMLNVDTFKNMCMMAKTEKGKEIRRYYVKLENIFNCIVNEERVEYENKLSLEKHKNQILEIENEEINKKIEVLTKKTNKYKLGQSVYIFKGQFENKEIYKLGKTKNANDRERTHKTSSFEGLVLQVTCVNADLLEKVIHFLLDKYRIVSRREWFDCSLKVMKNAIDYAKTVLERDVNFDDNHLIAATTELLDEFSESTEEMVVENEPEDIFTVKEYIPNDINDFEQFLLQNCDVNTELDCSYKNLKSQYKIWSKIPNNDQSKKLIEYLKTKFKTTLKRHNPLVSTSKKTNYFKGIAIKQTFFKFQEPESTNMVIEKFLFQRCQRAPGYRVTITDLLSEFENFYDKETNHVINEKVKAFFDITFIRLRTGNQTDKDNRLGGWLGVALKTDENPEPVLNYRPKNAKMIRQYNVSSNELIKEWSSVTDLADYLNKSRSVTSLLIKRHQQLTIDNVSYIFKQV